jgi:high mobility group protein B2
MAEPPSLEVDTAVAMNQPKAGKKRAAGPEKTFRKAPGAPKRFKSPYILFSIHRMDQHRQQMGAHTNVTSISKLVSDEWKALSDRERREWSERARLDKDRYNAEKSLYTGPWQIPSKRTRKDPSAPKRPMSAFLFYSQGKRKELKDVNPGLKNTEISRLLSERWKSASDDERLPFIEREKMERDVYIQDIAEWRKQKDEEEKALRQHRQRVAEQWMKFGYETLGTGSGTQVYIPSCVSINAAFMQQQQQHMVTHLTMENGLMPVPAPAMAFYMPVPSNVQQQQVAPSTTAILSQVGDGTEISMSTPPTTIPGAPMIHPGVGQTSVASQPTTMYRKFIENM